MLSELFKLEEKIRARNDTGSGDTTEWASNQILPW